MCSRKFLCVIFIFITINCSSILGGEKEKELWYSAAQAAIERRLQHRDRPSDLPIARNVVLIIGDGMGVSTLTAARILRGQRRGYPGEESDLTWDTFPSIAMSRTYNANAQIGESSACATALSCGIKANFETLGLDSSSQFENCFSSFSSRVPSILSWAQEQGKSTGIITTTRITHATPAAFYSHSPSRYWEDDSKLPASARRLCKDIARQLVEDEPGRNINVLLGGGRRHFVSTVTPDPKAPHKEGRRLDGRNLITDWIRNKKLRNASAEYVTNSHELLRRNLDTTEYLLGLFGYSHMDFNAERDKSVFGDPSLAEMTAAALKVLKRNFKGFFMMIEAGRIDHAHHFNNAYRALDETLSLDDAVKVVLENVNLTETLIVVTSDHSHVLTFGGFGTTKGNPIFGFDTKVSDVDNHPYTTLLYTSGPGSSNSRKSSVRSQKSRDAIQTAAIPRNWAAHGGEDVPVYALGPMDTTLFSGSIDQSYIPHAIAYAACLGPYKDRCECFDNCHTQSTILQPKPCVSGENSSMPCELMGGFPDDGVYDNDILGQPMSLVYNSAYHLFHRMYIFMVILIYLLKIYHCFIHVFNIKYTNRKIGIGLIIL